MLLMILRVASVAIARDALPTTGLENAFPDGGFFDTRLGSAYVGNDGLHMC